MANPSSATEFTIDVTDLKTLARDLRKIQPELAKELRVGLKQVAEPVRATAELLVGAVTKKAAGPIVTRTSGVTVKVVNKSTHPLAGLFEYGNKGQRGAATFRHPVFGNTDVWVTQKTHPYLSRALAIRQDQVVRGFVDLVGRVLEKVNL